MFKCYFEYSPLNTLSPNVSFKLTMGRAWEKIFRKFNEIYTIINPNK